MQNSVGLRVGGLSAVLTFASKVQTKKSWLFREVILKHREGGVAGKLTQIALFSFPTDCLQGGVGIRSQIVPHYECNVRQNHLMLRLKNTMFPNCFTNSYWQKSATNVRQSMFMNLLTISTAFTSLLENFVIATSNSALNLKGTTDMPPAALAVAVIPCHIIIAPNNESGSK